MDTVNFFPLIRYRRLLTVSALFGGFLLLGLASSALADGPDPEVTVDLIKINGVDPAAGRDNTFLAGETLTFKVTVHNDAAAGPANTLVGTHSFLAPDLIVGAGVPVGEQTIAPGDMAEYQVEVTVPADYSLDNRDSIVTKVEAIIEYDDEGDVKDKDQNLSLRLYVPRLFITKTAAATVGLGASPAPVIPYTISITNDGGAPATNVVVTDILDARLVVPDPLPAGCTASGQTITCTFASVPFNFQPFNPQTIQFTATVTGTECGITKKIANEASMTADHLSTPVDSNITQTTVTCATPTPTPTPSPTPTPTPTPTPSSSSSDDDNNGSSSSGSSSSSNSSSGSSSTGSNSAVGRVAGITSGPSAADLKAPDYIKFSTVPAVVDRLFFQVFGRKITPAESTCWKLRARSDKATLSKLVGAMGWHKAKGSTGFTAFCRPPKLNVSLVDDLFKIVYGRLPSASELKYWQRRHKDKPALTALRGAMAFHKAKGIQH